MIKRARVFQSMRLLHPLATVAKQSVIYKTYFPTLRLCRIQFQLYHATSPSYTSNRSGASPITSSTSSIEWVPSSENDWVQQLEKESDSESDEEEIFDEECLDDETKPPYDIDADAQFSKSLQKSTQNKPKKRGKHRFVDRIRIKAVGGYGGNGCCSFEGEKFHERSICTLNLNECRKPKNHSGSDQVEVMVEQEEQSSFKPTLQYRILLARRIISKESVGRTANVSVRRKNIEMQTVISP